MQKALAWSCCSGPFLHSACVYGYKRRSQQERPGVPLRGKLLAAFLLLRPFWMPQQVGKGRIWASASWSPPCSHPSWPMLSAVNLMIRIRSFIAALLLIFTSGSGASPQDGGVKNNHTAIPQLSSFAIEELLILQYPLCSRVIFGPECKGWACFFLEEPTERDTAWEGKGTAAMI